MLRSVVLWPLAFDSQDRPAIGYYDFANQALKYAHFNGASWDIETVGTPGEVGLYLCLKFDHAGNPGISFYDERDQFLKLARNNGGVWTIETVDNSGDAGQFNSLAFDPADRPVIGYYTATVGNVKVARFDGSTWIKDTIDSAYGTFIDVAVTGAGTPLVMYTYNGELKVAQFNGTSWDITTAAGSPDIGELGSMALGPLYPVISYFDFRSFRLRVTTYDGMSWNASTVEYYRQTYPGVSLAFDPAGQPALSFSKGSNAMFGLSLARRVGASFQVESVDGIANVPQSSLAFDGAGQPVIAYYDFDMSNLNFVRFNGATWDIQTVDPAQWSRSTLAFDGAGNPAIAYAREPSGLGYARWNGASWDLQTVDTASPKGCDLAFDGDGNPAISYYSTQLNFAHWEGSAWVIDAVDSPDPRSNTARRSRSTRRAGRPSVTPGTGARSFGLHASMARPGTQRRSPTSSDARAISCSIAAGFPSSPIETPASRR